MVLESLSNPFKAEMHPGWVALHGALYTLVGLGLAYLFFPNYMSLVTLFFVTAAAIPLLYNIIKYEEDKDWHELQEKVLLKEHSRAVHAYFMLFVGVTLTLALAFMLMPETMLEKAFEAQIATYAAINPTHVVTGQVTGHAGGMGFFSNLFLNNMRVLIFCAIFSFLYGAGAIFILTWNASVIALAIGNRIRTEVGAIAGATGLTKVGAYMSTSFDTVVFRYGIHGSLEIIAYIIAGLAGGIISVAVIKHHYKTKKFEHIILDSADLLLLAIAVLFLAGVWEAWITPFFY